jgi:predicted SnoaL-like aldol condensation-catalyzing enzyme
VGLEENKLLAHRYVEEVMAGKLDIAGEILADSFRYHRLNGDDSVGRQAYLENFVIPVLRAIPDWRAEIVAVVAEAGFVSDRVIITGSVNGERISGDAAHFWRVSDGRLAEGWTVLSGPISAAIRAAIATATPG